MAYSGQSFEGVIGQAKKDFVNIDLLFNTKRKRPERTSSFLITAKPVINKGAGAIGECGAIPTTCHDGNQYELTATYPLSTNQTFEQCTAHLYNAYILKVADSTAQQWAIDEATYGYSKILPIFEDVTALALLALNAKQRIIQSIKTVQTNGFLPSDLIVCVSTETYFELMELDIECCDIGVQTAQTGQILGNKLGVKRIIHVPTAILSAGLNVDDATTIDHLVYIQDYAPFITYCDSGIVVKDVNTENHATSISHLIGREYIEAGYLNDEIAGVPKTSIADGSAVKAYRALPVVMDKGTKKRGTKKIDAEVIEVVQTDEA